MVVWKESAESKLSGVTPGFLAAKAGCTVVPFTKTENLEVDQVQGSGHAWACLEMPLKCHAVLTGG